MGHDITAHLPGVDAAAEYAKRAAIIENYDHEAWAEAYDEYRQATVAAYLRRNAGDPMARVIYIALDCSELDHGVSGAGDRRSFHRSQIADALRWIAAEQEANGFVGLHDIPTGMKQLLAAFSDAGIDVVLFDASNGSGDATREQEFLAGCLAAMDASGSDSIDISFG